MEVISDKIKYIPATNDPLSADVYFIEGDSHCYLYDVGNNDDSLFHINQVPKEKVIILSHYHKDHIGNIAHINDSQLYVGKETYDTIGTGTIVTETFSRMDGINIEIIPCVSPHTDGSLIVNINNEYTLIADLFFTRPPFDKAKAHKMIETLQAIHTKYFVVSHQDDEKVIPKEKLIADLSEYFFAVNP